MSKFVKVCAMILAVTMMVSVLSACGSESSANANNAGSANEQADIGLLKSGIYKVGVEIGYPPFELFADDGVTPMGLDIDLANAIADILGVKVEFEDTAWDGIFAGLDVDKYDVVMSAVTITAERAKTMDFSNPYIVNWQSIAVRKGSDPITSVQGLEGLNVGFQGETTSDEYLTMMMDTGVVSCTKHSYDKVINAFDDLRNGRLDAVISDSVVSEGYIAREPDIFELTWHQSNEADEEPERFGVAVKKGNKALLDAVNNALKILEDNGKLDEIRDNWLS